MANDGPAERSRHAIKSMIPIDSSIRYKFGIKQQDVDDKELGALVHMYWLALRIRGYLAIDLHQGANLSSCYSQIPTTPFDL